MAPSHRAVLCHSGQAEHGPGCDYYVLCTCWLKRKREKATTKKSPHTETTGVSRYLAKGSLELQEKVVIIMVHRYSPERKTLPAGHLKKKH